MHYLALLGVDGVGDIARIAHVYLLVPALLARSVLALEWVEA